MDFGITRRPTPLAERPDTARPGYDTPVTRFGEGHTPRDVVLETALPELETLTSVSGEQRRAEIAVADTVQVQRYL